MHNHSSPPPSSPTPQPLSSFLTTTTSTAGGGGGTTTTTKISTPFILLGTCLFSLLLILSFSTSPTPPLRPTPHPSLFPQHHHLILHPTSTTAPPTPPSIAYLLAGSTNDTERILRLLHSIYHPKNFYLLHLDRHAPQTERDLLAIAIQSVPIFRAAQNVHVVGNADFANPKGSSSLSSTLHGASILLRLSSSWDWFINLSASDYPLVTQDDLLHILSYLPKDLNFVNHSSYIGWRESRKLKPIIVDPALYLMEKSETFYATQKRQLPDAYRLFSGSSSAILSRKFIEYSILGTNNLPRTLLMYLSNTRQSHSFYFPTILCNSYEFNRTTINHSLQYSVFDSRQEPLPLNSSVYNDLIQSGAAFASPFLRDDSVLDQIDQEVLDRTPGKPVPGGWCLGDAGNGTCNVWGDANVLRPGPGARRLERRLVQLFSNKTFQSDQCISD